MHLLHATNPGQGNPHIAAARSRADVTAPPADQTAVTPRGNTPTDEVRLSPKAQEIIASSGASQEAGTAAHATAHRARAIIELGTDLAGQPFGRIVSQVARGVLSLADVTPAGPPASEAAPATETGETTTAAAIAAGDPAEVVATPSLVPTVNGTETLIGDLIDALTDDTIEETV